MRLRQKYLIIFLSSVLLLVLSMLAISHLNLRGYALLPLIILAGLSLYTGFMSLLNIIVPSGRPIQDSLWSLLIDTLFGWF